MRRACKEQLKADRWCLQEGGGRGRNERERRGRTTSSRRDSQSLHFFRRKGQTLSAFLCFFARKRRALFLSLTLSRSRAHAPCSPLAPPRTRQHREKLWKKKRKKATEVEVVRAASRCRAASAALSKSLAELAALVAASEAATHPRAAASLAWATPRS